MKADIWTKYGPPDVLQIREIEKPAPKDNEVLIKIYATTVTAGDCELRSLSLPIYFSLPMRIWLGFRKPRINTVPGTELAGEIIAVGKDVKLFKPGDQVFGSSGLKLGANAEYICLPEEPDEGVLAIKPENMSYEESTTVPFGGLDALHFLRKANLKSGQKVLINGAGGSIGTFGVQLAKYFGAEVTSIDSADKLDMLQEIGSDHVIDYKREDFSRQSHTYDVIFDVAGKSSISGSLRSLEPNGFLLLANPRLSHMVRGLLTTAIGGKKVITQVASHKKRDLIFLRELIEEDSIKTVIDKSYPLEQVVEAHKYIETGQKKGNVVIRVGH